MSSFVRLFLMSYLAILSDVALAQNVNAPNAVHPIVAPRELIVLKPALDQVWGTWITAVIHRGESPEEVSFYLNIPREAVDFQAGEGLEPKDLKIQSDGVLVRKTFAPGVNVVSVVFAVPARYGVTSLTLVPKREVPEMSIMTPKGILTAKGDGLAVQPDDRQEGERYDVLGTTKPLPLGKEFVLDIAGVPEGRSRLWILGGIVGGLLILTAGVYAWRTRPQKTGAEDGEGVLA